MPAAVDLRPVEGHHPGRWGPSSSATRKPSGSNHSSCLRACRSRSVQPPCSGCSAKARALSSSHASSSSPGRKARTRTPSGSWGSRQRRAQRPAQLLQPADHANPHGLGEMPGRRVVTVRPQSQPAVRGLARRRLDQHPAVAAPPVGGVHHELGGRARHRVGRVEVGVPRHHVLAVRLLTGNQQPGGAGRDPHRRSAGAG